MIDKLLLFIVSAGRPHRRKWLVKYYLFGEDEADWSSGQVMRLSRRERMMDFTTSHIHQAGYFIGRGESEGLEPICSVMFQKTQINSVKNNFKEGTSFIFHARNDVLSGLSHKISPSMVLNLCQTGRKAVVCTLTLSVLKGAQRACKTFLFTQSQVKRRRCLSCVHCTKETHKSSYILWQCAIKRQLKGKRGHQDWCSFYT